MDDERTKVEDVGEPRFCPVCTASLMPIEYDDEEKDVMERRCSGCERPCLACPCRPGSEKVNP